MARLELFIWWTNSQDCQALSEHTLAALPDYVRTEYASRVGRAGRGRLWVDKRFGAQEIREWPKTSIATLLEEGSYGGVVFSEKDLHLFKDSVGGLVTDFRLRIMVVKP